MPGKAEKEKEKAKLPVLGMKKILQRYCELHYAKIIYTWDKMRSFLAKYISSKMTVVNRKP